MPNTKSAAKRLRQDRWRTSRTRRKKREIKKLRKAFETDIDKGNPEAAADRLKACYAALDKAASKKAIHKNEANRRKSRLAARFNKISS